jgi:hypothetical protein
MRRVRAEDLQDPRTGAAYTAIAGDAAFTFPMLEMAGHAHSRFRDEVLYHYNDTLPTNEAARDAESVHWYSYAIRMRGRRYPRLSEPCDGPAEPTSPPWEQRDAPIPPFE